ncbi:MAG: L-seryl-tRNA(Sec) selenium transferase [Dissulfurimicrobium sp.]|uniref:L-seryl-tRNA(Sec) selenium transferase n=2 Tax=Deltaproteobacteria incertae sedis TaxID=45456 RepID=UPI003C74D1D7
MAYSGVQKKLLKQLPKVDMLMDDLPVGAPHGLKLRAARETAASLREVILAGGFTDGQDILDPEHIKRLLYLKFDALNRPSLRPVVNATGVVVHTNLGRSLLPRCIFKDLLEIAGRYSNLEYNLDSGGRGNRYSHVEDLLCELTGAEAALVVNNNAAAVLIILETLAKGKEVVVSRGELVEIGGSFRIPDVMSRSGAILKEVGTTNKTHLKDYESAIGPDTALLLKVHQSNFSIIGFTKSVPITELTELGSRCGISVYEDLGSGVLIDLSRYGLMHEPTVQEALKAGVSVVSFSGDKLLGGPQAGIIVGRKEIIEKIKANPLNRAVRIDKLTLCALEGVLRLYRDPEKAVKTIPTLDFLTQDLRAIQTRAKRLLASLKALKIDGLGLGLKETISMAGGGSLPLERLRSVAVTVKTSMGLASIADMERLLRKNDPPVIVRTEDDAILMDARTILPDDIPIITTAVSKACCAAADDVPLGVAEA